MNEKIDLILRIKSTLAKISISGFEDADRYVGLFMALDKLQQLILSDGKAAESEEQKEEKTDG